jgi:hypothetical protein
MKFTVRTSDGELTFGSFGEVEKAWLMGLVGPDDELLEDGHTKWRKASSFPVLVGARRTGEQAWGGAWFLWAVISILMGSATWYFLHNGDYLFGMLFGIVTALLTINVTVRANKRARPHG